MCRRPGGTAAVRLTMKDGRRVAVTTDGVLVLAGRRR